MSNTPTPLETPISEAVELVPGLTFEWIFEGRGIMFKAQHSSHELVDAWANKVIEVSRNWPRDRRLFILNDFSGPACVTTPYSQQKNRELIGMHPYLQTYVAVVVRQNLTMQLSRLFVRALSRQRPIFLSFSQDEAMAWLRKHLTD